MQHYLIDKRINPLLPDTCPVLNEIEIEKLEVGEEGLVYRNEPDEPPVVIPTTARSQISKGTNGKVYLLASDDGKYKLAYKQIDDKRVAEQEALAFQKLNHLPCKVVTGVGLGTGILMPMMNGTLQDFQGRIHPEVLVNGANDLANLLYCLLQRGIFYPDVKPANILYRCSERNRFQIILGDVGDIVDLNVNYVSTFPMYKMERKDKDSQGKDAPQDYHRLAVPLGIPPNVETHLTWSVAVFFFVMLKPPVQHYLNHNRDLSTEEFNHYREKTVELLNDNQYTSLDGAEIFSRALLDPASVPLEEFFKKK